MVLSLSLSLSQCWCSHHLSKLSQANSLNVTLLSSLIHRRRPDSSSTSPPPNLDITNPSAASSHGLASDSCRHPPQTHTADRLKPISLLFSLSLSIFSSNRVPHYPTHLKSEHFVSLCTHHHYLWSLINDWRRSRRLVPNRTEYQPWVSVWLCWFF